MKVDVLLLAGCIAGGATLSATAAATNARIDANATGATPGAARDDAASADEKGDDAVSEPESAQDDARVEAWQNYREQVIDAMIDSASPREWALAASTLFSGDEASSKPLRPTRAALMQRAADRAPDDALVQWLVALDRLNTSTCKAAPAPDENVRALLGIEPGNAAAWMLALRVAAQRNDNAAIDDALAHMASSSTYDDHFGDNLVARIDVYDRFPMPDLVFEQQDEMAFAMPDAANRSLASFTTAMAEASAMPSYGALIKVCKPAPETSANWQRYAYCEDAGRVMLTKGTTLIAHGIGFAVLRNLGEQVLTPEDQTARRNDYWWREQSMATFMLDAQRGYSATFVADWRNTRNETEVARRALRRNGLSTEAPAGWIPPGTQAPAATASGSD